MTFIKISKFWTVKKLRGFAIILLAILFVDVLQEVLINKYYKEAIEWVIACSVLLLLLKYIDRTIKNIKECKCDRCGDKVDKQTPLSQPKWARHPILKTIVRANVYYCPACKEVT